MGGGRRPTDRGRDPERGRPDPPKGVGLCLSLSLSLSLGSRPIGGGRDPPPSRETGVGG